MKFIRISLLVVASIVILSSCTKDDCTQDVKYLQYTPVYAEKEDVRSLLSITAPQDMRAPGKIYAYQNYLFISDRESGIHIIDNADPKNPTPISFINAPGARDMAVRGDYLYIDHYTDLVVIDIRQPAQATILETVQDVFLEHGIQQGSQVITGYVEEEVMLTTDCDEFRPWFFDDSNVDVLFVADNLSVSETSTNRAVAAATGTGGSFARFVVTGDNLYTVGQSSLSAIDLTNPVQPVVLNQSNIGWDIETIFASGEYLFVGSQSGMFIISIENPDNPEIVSEFIHAQACDPVYVRDNVAYVTLRDGNDCGENINVMLVVDVSNVYNPVLLEEYDMVHPHGLTVSADELTLAQGAHGLFIYDLEDKASIQKRYQDDTHHAYDVIRLGTDHVLVIGDDGLYQYRLKQDYLELLSVLSAI